MMTSDKFQTFTISRESPQEELYDVGRILESFEKDGVPADAQPRQLMREMYAEWFLDLALSFVRNPVVALKAMLWNWTPPEIAEALGLPEPMSWERE